MSDLTREQAQALVDQINALSDSLYERLIAFHAGRGWLALGYASFKDCAYAVFKVRHAQLYRWLAAAYASEDTGTHILPSHAPLLAKLPAGKQVEAVQVATQLAVAAGKDTYTVSELRQSVDYVRYPTVYAAWIAKGAITAVQAVYAINAMSYDEHAPLKRAEACSALVDLAQRYGLHDVGAIVELAKRYRPESETWQAVVVTGRLDIGTAQVPLLQARADDVEACWQAAQRQHVAENTDHTQAHIVTLWTDTKRTVAALRREFGEAWVKQLGDTIKGG